MAVFDGLRDYRRIHCSESEAEKRRRFAVFKAEVEAGQDARRWAAARKPGKA